MQRIVRSAILAGLLWGGLVPSSTSSARAQAHRDFDYTYEQVWNTLVRLIRVDYRFAIDERDDVHGFVLFQYRDHGRTHAASLELVRAPATTTGTSSSSGAARTARERIRLAVHIDGMPNRAEARVLDDLVDKLRADYGPPPSVVDEAAAVDGAASLRPRLSPAPSRIPTSDVPPGAAEVTPPTPPTGGTPTATPPSSPTTATPGAASATTAPTSLANAGAPAEWRAQRTSDVQPTRSARSEGRGGPTGGEFAETRRAEVEPTPASPRGARGRRADTPRDGVRLSEGPPAELPPSSARVLLR